MSKDYETRFDMECDCNSLSHTTRFSYFHDTDTDWADPYLYVTSIPYVVRDFGIWFRIKEALKFVFSGVALENSCTMMAYKDREAFMEFMNSYYEHVKHLEECDDGC